MNGQERNKQSLEALFSARDDSRRPIKSGNAPAKGSDSEKLFTKISRKVPSAKIKGNNEEGHYIEIPNDGKVSENYMNSLSEDLLYDGYKVIDDKIRIYFDEGDFGTYSSNLNSSRRLIKSNAYTDGYDAYYNRLEKSDNPYFKAANPIEQQEWERGWDVAEQDYKAQLFGAQEEDEMLYNSHRPVKSDLNVQDEAAYWDGLEDAACGLAPADEDDPSYMKGYRNGKKRSGQKSYADKIYDDELASSRKPIKSAADTLHCVYVSDIKPQYWTKNMALSAIKNSVTNYGCYDYNGRTGMILVGDFDDIYHFIESNEMVVDEDYIYHWKEFDWDNAKKLDKRYIGEKPNNVVSSRKHKISSSQRGFENVAEGTQYDDYYIDTTGMGILDVEHIISEIEGRGNQAVLTVQTSDGVTQHTQFTLDDWKKYKNAVNGVDEFSRNSGSKGAAITDVWVTEVKGGSYVRNSRRPIKSNVDRNTLNNIYNDLVSILKFDGINMNGSTEDYQREWMFWGEHLRFASDGNIWYIITPYVHSDLNINYEGKTYDDFLRIKNELIDKLGGGEKAPKRVWKTDSYGHEWTRDSMFNA